MDRLSADKSVLVVVDVQERLAAVVPEDARARLIRNAEVLLETAARLNVPVLASQQYTKGLGPTVSPLRERLEKLGVVPFEKLDFDACEAPAFARALANLAQARQAVVIGMEAHICVFQTARELARRGYVTYVAEDAVASRTEENRLAGMSLVARAGAVPTVTEAIVFDWLRRAGTDDFKAVSRLIK
ncbi:isochorismatase family protein [Pendulispora albinea]|uniref:Isochorismatase family protein n=1 Tax=Pendulispora albinea TaxID=2741071 RepID=A0ABZ2LQS2_9BACT